MAEYVVVNAELPETSQHDGDGMDISANGSMQQLDCTSPSASSTVPADDMREMLTAVAQHSDLAAALRQKGQAGRAVRTLERAVAMCARAEHIHPAVAVEAARARVNLAAALSEAARHREAIAHVRKAQRGLDQILAWAEQCGDAGATSIAGEASALRCAALVAESIELDMCPGVSGDFETTLNETALLRDTLTPKNRTVSLPQIGRKARKEKKMRIKDDSTSKTHSAGALKSSEVATEKRQPVIKLSLRPRAAEERTDVFSDFLRGVEAERVARLGALNDNWEDQAKRRLGQVHRRTRLQLELMGDNELKEKRYTHTGHQVFMKAMKKANRCWSDTSLLQEAAKENATPEILQVRKLNRQLYVKPPTPPPPPPPKPKMDQALVNNLRSNHGRASIKAEA
ncbi:HERC1 [Symbiodinium pilosum]|uniref:HERC1 protein n=1 Tax=Symbiodinium pilosum TaxID=2952 RepID=A0A812VAM7_SYMPI|nr:HERC1 [Symbiodinium pilosum]